MTTFGLVHGHWHGAWCWDALRRELDAHGHQTVAMDLPCTELDAGCARNAEVVAAALEGVDGELVLVGHSAGGLTVPLLPALRPVRRLVFLAALLPVPGRSLAQQFDEERVIVAGFDYVDRGDGLTEIAPEMALYAFYHDCDAETARAAAARLRPQTAKTIVEVTPLAEWPEVDTAYIACEHDRVIEPAWQLQAARERLRTEPLALACGHSPALARTRELAQLLDGLA